MMESTRSNQVRVGRILLAGMVALILSVGFFAAGLLAGFQLASARTANAGGEPASAASTVEPAQADMQQTEQEVDLDVFWEVWNTLESRFYYDLPSEEDRVRGAINGLVESLDDPYTAYVDPEVARILNEDSSGTFEGIGAFVEEAPEGGVFIIRVFDGGPAEKAGLRAGDIILAVDGQDITDKILNESLLLIRGPAGTNVTLTVFRENEQDLLEFNVTRARLEVPTVEYRILEDNIGYVALYEFNARSSDRLSAAVRDLIDQGAEKLILDLRGNPGGFLDESVKVADMFLPRGLVLVQRDVDGNRREYTSQNGDFAEGIPLVVLINGGSASASEIVAAAIQDNERGTLIGETSFGKGSVQLQYNLSDGSLLRVTYANWYTPNDVSITEQGVTPDIVVETPDEPGSTDIQLERAIEFLQTGQ